MPKVKYILSEAVVNKTITYNIEVIENETTTCVIPTDFKERQHAKNFVAICNKFNVEKIHVRDVMKDILYDIWVKENSVI